MDETPAQRQARLASENERALKWLSDHWQGPPACPVCTSQRWNVGNVVEMREFEGGNLVIGGHSGVLPVSPIACAICGYTFFMNALRSGAIVNPNSGEGSNE